MTTGAQSFFTLRAAQEKLGLSRTVLTGLISAGFVTPGRSTRGELKFSFQDLLLLRTAYALQRGRIAPSKILRSLADLKASLPTELPLTGLRITAVGPDVAVRDPQGLLEATSGQLLMDFDVSPANGSVAFLDRPVKAKSGEAISTAEAFAIDLFKQGESLEATAPEAAESAYREALRLDPDLEAAYLNLGALLCEAGRCADAIGLYETAVDRCPDSPLIRFNRAVVLEDQDRIEDAMASYERSLELDPGLADAHFNLGRLQQKSGDARAALKHFSAYRRLQR